MTNNRQLWKVLISVAIELAFVVWKFSPFLKSAMKGRSGGLDEQDGRPTGPRPGYPRPAEEEDDEWEGPEGPDEDGWDENGGERAYHHRPEDGRGFR